MNPTTKTEIMYESLDKAAGLLQKELGILYLEALSLAGNLMIHQNEPVNGLSEDAAKQLEQIVKEVRPPFSYDKEEGRRALQLAVLKGMKEATQPHHAMTPDAVTVFAGFLVSQLLQKESDHKSKILDPAAGAGNLLTGVMNQQSTPVYAIGVEADETLANLLFINSGIQGLDLAGIHDDSVKMDTFDEQVDLVVSDLPVGYYPDEQVIDEFRTKAQGTPTYVHHLLIEKSIEQVKEGGFLLFLIPNAFFQSEQADILQAYLKDSAVIYALLQLPETMFKAKEQQKSFLLLRKKQKGMAVPQQALLAEMPSFSRKEALQDMTRQISDWLSDHLS